MDVISLQAKLSRGLGLAALKLGTQVVVYRPDDCSQPLSNRRRVTTMSAAFEPDGQPVTSKGTVNPIWRGIFDSNITRQADYLVGSKNTYFVGDQRPGSLVRCILTNRVISLARATFVAQGGYSGLSDTESQHVLVGWPANLTEQGSGVSGQSASGSSFGAWTVLLPVLPTAPHAADVMTDDLGSTYVVNVAEQNLLGWRLLVRQIGAQS